MLVSTHIVVCTGIHINGHMTRARSTSDGGEFFMRIAHVDSVARVNREAVLCSSSATRPGLWRRAADV